MVTRPLPTYPHGEESYSFLVEINAEMENVSARIDTITLTTIQTFIESVDCCPDVIKTEIVAIIKPIMVIITPT